MNICIGIISYLPDSEDLRKERQKRVINLINQIDKHFNLPIILIAQNYKDFNINSKNIIRYNYDKLGITGARRELRIKFLESEYDYVIMLDDDMELSDNQQDYDIYINNILKYKKEYYYVRNFLNNFSVMSKEGFKKLDYDPEICVENGTGFEDWIFSVICTRTLNSMRLTTNLPKYERKHFLNDKYSTWSTDGGSLLKQNQDISAQIVRDIRLNSNNKKSNHIHYFTDYRI